MTILNMFYLVICWTQKVHNDFIFLCSIILPPVGHSSNHEYHCWNLQDNRTVVRIFFALLRFSFDSPSYLPIPTREPKSLICLFWSIKLHYPTTEGYRNISHLRHIVILRPTINWTPYKLHISRKSITIKILNWKLLLSLLPHNFAVSHVVITDSGKGKFSYRSSWQISWNSVSWFKRLNLETSGSVPSYTVNYIHELGIRICCHNTDPVHVNGHDRIILVIFSQALHKASWWWILCDLKHVGALLNIL